MTIQLTTTASLDIQAPKTTESTQSTRIFTKSSRPWTTSEPKPTTTAKTIITYMHETCQLNENEINFVPGDCSAFFECGKGLPSQIQKCGEGTMFFFDFDQKYGYCNYEELVDCNDHRRQ